MRPIRLETRVRASLAALAAVVWLASPLPAAAQQGAVAGQVTEETGTRGIEGAQVFITGTNLGSLTDAQGRYRIERGPAGTAEVQVRCIGYQTAVRTVTVTAGQTTTASFSLAVQALGVDELVVTAVGDQRRRELGNSVAAISGDISEEAPITEFSDLITGRAAGVQVLPSGGTTGTGGRVRIRGSSSVSLGNEPLIYVDGARISSDAADSFQDLTGGQAPSGSRTSTPRTSSRSRSCADRPPPPCTAPRPRTASSASRRSAGAEGRTRWRLWAEGGVLEDANEYPANYQGLDANGDPCDLLAVAAGTCMIRYSSSSDRQKNGVYTLNVESERWTVANGEGLNGLLYRDAFPGGDPRTPWQRLDGDVGFDTAIPQYDELKYPAENSDLPLATGIEARLIEAEAALQVGDVAAFDAIHTALRATAGLGALSTGALSTGERVDVHFSERAVWLWITGHRHGDLRRLVRQYGRPAESVFPTGAYFKVQTGHYGTDVNLQVPFDEENNPNFDQCIDRGA